MRSFVSKNWTDEQDRELTELNSQNLSMEEIARRTNRTSSAVRSRLCVFGLKSRKKRKTPSEQRIAEAIRLSALEQHKTYDQRIVDQDAAFQRAMKVAIRMGLERAPIGVFKDTRHKVLVRVG